MVTSDKVYLNNEWVYPYRETDTLGGHDPYSASKAASEIIISSYRNAFLESQGVAISSARAGNVIGGGDWSEDRLIPDAIRSWSNDRAIEIRNPDAVRPWQHVLEPLSGYLVLCQQLLKNPIDYSEAWNFGPNEQDARPVQWILDKMISYWPNASWSLDNNVNPHEASFLKLNISNGS